MEVERAWLTASELHAVVIMRDMGFRCGYVAVDKSHPFYEKPLGDSALEGIEVHGGVTFAGFFEDTGQEWWIGFDCGHCFDAPSKEFIESLPGVIKVLFGRSMGVHRDLAYCVKECEYLAHQLAVEKLAVDVKNM
jgi:hypothetical protein